MLSRMDSGWIADPRRPPRTSTGGRREPKVFWGRFWGMCRGVVQKSPMWSATYSPQIGCHPLRHYKNYLEINKLQAVTYHPIWPAGCLPKSKIVQ